MPDEFYKVSEINKFIKDVVNAGFPQNVWVCGEIQGYNRNKDRTHVFFELVEKHPESKEIVARIGLVIFAGKKSFIQSILKKSENAFDLKDDIEVKFACKVDFYMPHGAVRLVVETIDPVYTLGKLAQERLKLIALLKEKGVLDQNKKLELSLVPLRLGLITAADSAAYNDFIDELKRSGFAFQVILRDCVMQGKKTEGDVSQAIKELNRLKTLDAIVVTRGGGSIADLACFDSQMIAETIAQSQLPVLSGIGHEINTTVTDLAAHTFEKTPTAIAQFLVGRVQQYLDVLSDYQTQILNQAQEKIAGEKEKLRRSAVVLQTSTRQFVKKHNERLIRMRELIRREPAMLLKDQRRHVADVKKNFMRAVNQRLLNDKQKLAGFEKLVDILHPGNTIKRGFSITRHKNGKIVRGLKDVQSKEELLTEVSDGIIKSRVINEDQQQLFAE